MPEMGLGLCDFAVHSLKDQGVPSSDLLKYYELMRGYVEHEDNLINSRLTWSLTIHGFLFATLGILIGKLVDIVIDMQKSPGPKQLEKLQQVAVFLIFLQLIPAIVGFIVACFSFLAIRGGHYANQHLNEIAHVSGPLRIRPSVILEKDVKDVEKGPQRAEPISINAKRKRVRGEQDGANPMDGIEKWTQLIVTSGGKTENTEYVIVIDHDAKGFTADFKKPHKAPVSFTLQGRVEPGSQNFLLFPRILGGGDRARYTKGAGLYYLALAS
jgi:hypothetical protein